jgi:hypothetical protein
MMRIVIESAQQAEQTISSLSLRAEAIASLARGFIPGYEVALVGSERIGLLEVEGGWLVGDAQTLVSSREEAIEALKVVGGEEEVGEQRKATWGYECVAVFGGKPGGVVRGPGRGGLFASRAEARKECKAGTARTKRVRAILLDDGSLGHA